MPYRHFTKAETLELVDKDSHWDICRFKSSEKWGIFFLDREAFSAAAGDILYAQFFDDPLEASTMLGEAKIHMRQAIKNGRYTAKKYESWWAHLKRRLRDEP
jgi:hypothetical protein